MIRYVLMARTAQRGAVNLKVNPGGLRFWMSGEPGTQPAAEPAAEEAQVEEVAQEKVEAGEEVAAEEEVPEKDYRRFVRPRKASGPYQNISKSDIDNLTVLTDSYLFRHQAEEMEAVRNRLDEMKSEYPLDLASLLERKGSSNTQYAIESKWARIANYAQPNPSDVARIVERMIKEQCFESVIRSQHEAEFVIYMSCTYDPLQAVLKLDNGAFLKRYLNEKIIIGILDRVASQKFSSKNLQLLRYFNIMTQSRNAPLNAAQIAKLLQLPESSCMSRLELMYFLMKLSPRLMKNAFSLERFLKEIRTISLDGKGGLADEIGDVVENKVVSKPLQYLLAEVFFTSIGFQAAVTNLYALIVLLSRLLHNLKAPEPTTIHDILEAMVPPSAEWVVDNFEKRLPSILDTTSKNLYSRYTRLYGEHLFDKQNPQKASQRLIGEATLTLSTELYVGEFKVLPPFSHERKRQAKQRGLLKRSTGEQTQPPINRQLAYLDATVAGDLSQHVEELFSFFGEHGESQQNALRKIMDELPNTPEYQQIVASAPEGERQAKLALLFLRAASDVIRDSTEEVTLRNVLTTSATKRRRYTPVREAEVEVEAIDAAEEAVAETAAEGEQTGELSVAVEEPQAEEAPVEEGQVEETPAQEAPAEGQATPLPPAPNKEELRLNRFQKKGFSTIKQAPAEEPKSEKEEKQDGLANYLKALKQVDQKVAEEGQSKEEAPSTASGSVATLLESIAASNNFQEACKHVFSYIRQNRSQGCFDELIKQTDIKYFKNGERLLLGIFFHGTVEPRVDVQTPSAKLVCTFETELGQMEKDYNKYLNPKICAIDFALSPQSYNLIIKGLIRTYSRRELKCTMAHLAQYCVRISDETVKLLCELCDRERVAFTTLEFAQLLHQNNVAISLEAFTSIARVLKNYKDIADEIPALYRKYQLANKWDPSPEPIEGYIGNLVKTGSSGKLNKVIDMIKELSMPRKYRFQDNLSAEDNTRLENESKAALQKTVKQTAFKLASVCSRYGEAQHAETLFDQYHEGSVTYSDTDLALSYLCYSNNAEKFRNMLELQAKRPITTEQFQNAIKALDLRPRILQNEIQKVLDIFVYDQMLVMNEHTVAQLSKIIRRSDNLLLFSRFLQHLLRTQPPLSAETKRLFYRILNQTKEDGGKNYIKGLLDILFEKEKKEERQKYKETWEAEQVKKNKLDQMKKEALTKIQQRRKVEQQEEEALIAKHGLKSQAKADSKTVPEVKPEGKKSKKQKQEPAKQAKTEPVKQPGKPSTQVAKTEKTETPEQPKAAVVTPSKKDKSAKSKQVSPKKDSGAKKEAGDKSKPDSKDAKKGDSKAAQPERKDLINLEDKKHISDKIIRRGGRNKFFELAMTDEQIEEEQNSTKKKRGGRN